YFAQRIIVLKKDKLINILLPNGTPKCCNISVQ
ncbi:MAG: hypothetical protein ACI8R1_001555, partial [Psychrobacter glaciei]